MPKSTYWEASKTWKHTRHVQRRRFSKPFIRGEIIQRNEYRQAVRFFQQHASLFHDSSFPYDIPEAIPVGTAVAALNTQQIISRGTVRSHNSVRATYLIDFGEAEGAAQEISDIHVATIGGPELLISAIEKSSWGECNCLLLLGKSAGYQQVCNSSLR